MVNLLSNVASYNIGRHNLICDYQILFIPGYSACHAYTIHA